MVCLEKDRYEVIASVECVLGLPWGDWTTLIHRLLSCDQVKGECTSAIGGDNFGSRYPVSCEDDYGFYCITDLLRGRKQAVARFDPDCSPSSPTRF
jgi:hypothetical protein